MPSKSALGGTAFHRELTTAAERLSRRRRDPVRRTRISHAAGDFAGHPGLRRKRETIAMVRSLAALATAAAAPASGQPIDLLAPPTLTAPRNNVAPSDTRPATAAPMPGPSLASDEPPVALLEAARRALEAGRTGEAQEALERAETRLLVQASLPESQQAVLAIGAARRALAANDRQGAIRAIEDAVAAVTLSTQVVIPSPPPAAPTQPAPAPIVTYALLPGHWQLRGAEYVWVPPETVPRPVAYWRFVQGRYVWRGSEWIWVPAHYE
jgi:hypothetical protein